MNYKPHLERIQAQFGVLDGYNDISDFEKCIIILKQNNCTYKQIQKWLGNPHKDLIKEVINKYIPETLNNDCNKHKLKSQKYPNESRLIGLLNLSESKFYDLDEFGLTNFWIIDGRVYFMSEDKYVSKFIDWDERTQKAIIINVANILNVDII